MDHAYVTISPSRIQTPLYCALAFQDASIISINRWVPVRLLERVWGYDIYYKTGLAPVCLNNQFAEGSVDYNFVLRAGCKGLLSLVNWRGDTIMQDFKTTR